MSRAERIPDVPTLRASPDSRERREPPEHRFGREPHAEPVEHAGPELRGESDDVARPRALMRDDGERVAGGQADRPIPPAPPEARALREPGGGEPHPPAGAEPARPRGVA